jgi:hypothetical protein
MRPGQQGGRQLHPCPDAAFMATRRLDTFSDLLQGDLPAHRVYQLGKIEIFLRQNLPTPDM